MASASSGLGRKGLAAMSETVETGREGILERFVAGPGKTLRTVLELIDSNGEGVVVVTGEDGAFLGIVTDGDIRRGLLTNADFNQPVGEYLKRKTGPGPDAPLTVLPDTPDPERLAMMDRYGVRHLPLVDREGKLVGIALRSDLVLEQPLAMRAVVMAGGKGMRLRPLTEKTPKPLLPVGNKPLIEHIVGQLRDSGVHNISITTHYHADQIQEHFGDGSGFGVNMQYTREEEPLGTAGALAYLPPRDEPVLVINGDILTSVDFGAMLDFHREHASHLTVGVRQYDISVPFGVVEADGVRVSKLSEKPSLSFFINAGIYLLEPEVLKRIPKGQRLDMTDLIDEIMTDGLMVSSFPIHEYWMDIGQLGDYAQAQADAGQGKLKK